MGLRRTAWRNLLASLLVGLVLVQTAAVAAWHEEHGQKNEKYGAIAGDPQVLEDASACLEKAGSKAKTECVVFYAHIFDLKNPAPINTQRPAACAPDLARGYTGNVVQSGSLNEIELYSAPSFVEYQEGQCGGPGQDPPRIHPERGLTSDIRLSGEAPVYGYWYLSADSAEFATLSVGTGPDNGPSSGLMPCVTVRMELWTHRYPGDGALIGEGETTKTVLSTPEATPDLAGTLGTQVDDVCPGSQATIDPEEVTEFQVAMEPSRLLIPHYEGYVIRVQWYQHDQDGTPGEAKIVQRDWNLRTGELHPNRIVLPVEDAVSIEKLELHPWSRPRSDEGFPDQVIQLDLRAPWGAYDLDLEDIKLHLIDDKGIKTPLTTAKERFLHHCGLPYIEHVMYLWNPETEDLGPGTYTLQATVSNWQHTAEATHETQFTLQQAETLETAALPGPGIMGFLLLLGGSVGVTLARARLLGTRARRRRNR